MAPATAKPWHSDQQRQQAPSPLWQQLQSASSSGAEQDVVFSLQQLAFARQTLGVLSTDNANLLVYVLTRCLVQAASTNCSEQIAALSLQLLARWAVQTQRSRLQPSAESIITTVVSWIAQAAPWAITYALFPHLPAAIILACGCLYPMCLKQQQALLLQAVHQLLDADDPANPMASLASTTDTCTGCELLLPYLTGAQSAPEVISSSLRLSQSTPPAVRLVMSMINATVRATTAQLENSTRGNSPDFHMHMPLTTFPTQPSAIIMRDATSRNHAQTHTLGILLTSDMSSEPKQHCAYDIVTAAAALSIAPRISGQIALRLIAQLGSFIERWAADCVRQLSAAAVGPAATVLNVLQQTAMQVQVMNNKSLPAAVDPAISLQQYNPSAQLYHKTDTLGQHLIYVQRQVSSINRSYQVPIPSDATYSPSYSTASVCCSAVAAAGLLHGIVAGLQHATPQNRAPLKGKLQHVIASLASTVQTTLSAACKQAASNLASNNVTPEEALRPTQHTVIATQGHQTRKDATALQIQSSSLLLQWSAGYIHGHLSEHLMRQGLEHIILVPGPLAVFLPAAVVQCLLSCILSLEPLLCLVMQSSPASCALQWLQEVANSNPLLTRVAPLARSVISALNASQSSSASGVDPKAAAAAAMQPSYNQQGNDGQAAATKQQLVAELQSTVLQALSSNAQRAAQCFSLITTCSETGWTEQLGSSLRSLLDQLYVVACTPLAALYASWSPATRPAAIPAMLKVVSSLHFCAVPLPQLQETLQRLVSELLANPDACQQFLDNLPCYETLVSPAPCPVSINHSTPNRSLTSHSVTHLDSQQGSQVTGTRQLLLSSRGPRWLVDNVIAAQIQYAMPLTTAATCNANDPLAAAHQLLPYLFLFLKHPHSQISSVAHSSLAGLVSRLCEKGLTQLAPQTLPYLLQRSLQQPWDVDQLEALEKALPAVLSSLPPGSQDALAGLLYIIHCAADWYLNNPSAHLVDFNPLYQPHQTIQQTANTPPVTQGLSSREGTGTSFAEQSENMNALQPEAKLISMACSTLLLADWQLLPAVVDALTDLIACAANSNEDVSHGRHTSQQTQLLQYIHDMLLRSDDYVRKYHLSEWLFALIRKDGSRAASKSNETADNNTRPTWLRRLWPSTRTAPMQPNPTVDMPVVFV